MIKKNLLKFKITCWWGGGGYFPPLKFSMFSCGTTISKLNILLPHFSPWIKTRDCHIVYSTWAQNVWQMSNMAISLSRMVDQSRRRVKSTNKETTTSRQIITEDSFIQFVEEHIYLVWIKIKLHSLWIVYQRAFN